MADEPGAQRTQPGKEPDEGLSGAHFANVWAIGGFALAVLGTLSGLGLAFLPSSTLGEKFLIFLASAALSVAGTAGVGAWRSGKRFAITAFSAGTSVVLIALLSISAAAQSRIGASSAANTQAARGGKAGTSGVPPSSAPSSLTPSPTPTGPYATMSPSAHAATSGPPLYLSTLTGSGSSWEDSSWQLAGVTYSQSVGDPDPCNDPAFPDSVTYQLPGRYKEFIATVGVADNADPLDQSTPLDFEVDGNPNTDGSTNELGTKSAQWHEPSNMVIPLPNDTTSLTLTISSGNGDCESSAGVWGNARVVP
jgi:NPCBM/NEW2 domain